MEYIALMMWQSKVLGVKIEQRFWNFYNERRQQLPSVEPK
jgi:hypothetical protein